MEDVLFVENFSLSAILIINSHQGAHYLSHGRPRFESHLSAGNRQFQQVQRLCLLIFRPIHYLLI